MGNLHFNGLAIVPTLNRGKTTGINVHPRTLLYSDRILLTTSLARDLGPKESYIMTKGDKYFTSHVHIDSLLYEDSIKPGLFQGISTENKGMFIALLHDFSSLLASLLRPESIPRYEDEFRILLEHALRSGMKVYRDVLTRGYPFIIEDLLLCDIDNIPFQIDDFRVPTMPSVSDYFERKITRESDINVQTRYQRFIRRYGEDVMTLFVQQAGTWGAELYHTWKQQVSFLDKEIYLYKN